MSNIPVVDNANPLYCPAFSASAYVDSLRRRLHRYHNSQGKSSRQNALATSFVRCLDQALFKEIHSLRNNLNQNGSGSGTVSIASHPGSFVSTSGFSYSVPAWERGTLLTAPANGQRKRVYNGTPSVHPRKRKREHVVADVSGFSDLRGPIKRGRSLSSGLSDSSHLEFLSQKGALDYFLPPGSSSSSRASLVHDESLLSKELFATERGSSGARLSIQEPPFDLQSLVNALDALLPGSAMKQRISSLSGLTIQKVVEILAHNGNLTFAVLTALRTLPVTKLHLTASIIDSDGLNLSGPEILPVLREPGGFLELKELCLTEVPLQSADIVNIHHLPSLAHLSLDNTGISNEAIFLLVNLKHTLTYLTVAANPSINDDCVPALILFSKLTFLSIRDTGIGMAGLRRLATVIYHEHRPVDIEIPTVCERYIDNLHTQYMINPPPPSITSPSACDTLSTSALRRNLLTHATFNTDIIAGGSKREMVARLTGILETRRLDLIVRAMVCGSENDVSLVAL